MRSSIVILIGMCMNGMIGAMQMAISVEAWMLYV